jgi:excinuclease ABC subunit A
MAEKFIRIGGAREHNLKNLTLDIPRDRLVVITGLSGSGKSSLAFDTIYAEGQRKYVESLSAYARQFLDQMQKPEVDFIEGLSPASAIEQRRSGWNALGLGTAFRQGKPGVGVSLWNDGSDSGGRVSKAA